MVFIESSPFRKRLEELAGEDAQEVLRQIQGDLLKNPERGNLVQGLGGARKARSANPARRKGKRGGYRYFFLYLVRRHHIHLLLLLDKDEQADLAPAERKALRKIVEVIKEEGRDWGH